MGVLYVSLVLLMMVNLALVGYLVRYHWREHKNHQAFRFVAEPEQVHPDVKQLFGMDR